MGVILRYSRDEEDVALHMFLQLLSIGYAGYNSYTLSSPQERHRLDSNLGTGPFEYSERSRNEALELG